MINLCICKMISFDNIVKKSKTISIIFKNQENKQLMRY